MSDEREYPDTATPVPPEGWTEYVQKNRTDYELLGDGSEEIDD